MTPDHIIIMDEVHLDKVHFPHGSKCGRECAKERDYSDNWHVVQMDQNCHY